MWIGSFIRGVFVGGRLRNRNIRLTMLAVLFSVLSTLPVREARALNVNNLSRRELKQLLIIGLLTNSLDLSFLDPRSVVSNNLAFGGTDFSRFNNVGLPNGLDPAGFGFGNNFNSSAGAFQQNFNNNLSGRNASSFGFDNFNNGFSGGGDPFDTFGRNSPFGSFANQSNFAGGGNQNQFNNAFNGLNGFQNPALANHNQFNNNQFNQLQPQRFGRGRIFGDAAHAATDAPTGARPLSDGSSDVCRTDGANQICGSSLAQSEPENQAKVQTVLNGVVDIAGTLTNSAPQNLMRMMKRIARTQSVAPRDREKYGTYLDGVKGPIEIDELAKTAKDAMKAVINGPDFPGDRSLALKKIEGAKIVDRPNFDNPLEFSHYLITCGVANREETAFACPFHHEGNELYIFMCGGRKAAALARAGGNMELAKVDLLGTMVHELGHLIGSEKSSPFSGAMSSLAQCFSNANRHPADSEYNAENTADFLGSKAVAQLIKSGNTFGLDPKDFSARTLIRLCNTGGSEHEDGLVRISRALQVQREERAICGPLASQEKTCDFKGEKSGGI